MEAKTELEEVEMEENGRKKDIRVDIRIAVEEKERR